jgi:hypothetical protein
VGLKVGGSLNAVRLDQSYSALNVSQNYKSTVGYQFGGSFYYFLNSNLALRGNILKGGTSINHTMTSDELWEKTYIENLTFMNYTLGAAKYFDVKPKVKAFVGADAGVLTLSGSNVTVNSTNFTPESFKVDTKDALNDRNKIQPNFTFLVGTPLELERGSFDIELGYSYFINNTIVAETRMEDIDFILDSQYINDDIKLGLISLNFVYSLPINYRIGK